MTESDTDSNQNPIPHEQVDLESEFARELRAALHDCVGPCKSWIDVRDLEHVGRNHTHVGLWLAALHEHDREHWSMHLVERRTGANGRKKYRVEIDDDAVSSVGDIPVCRGCGLASHVETHSGICHECWERRERRAGGGGLRIVTPNGTIHRSPQCPGVQTATRWEHRREEDCLYARMGDGGLSRCKRCFDVTPYRTDSADGDQEVSQAND